MWILRGAAALVGFVMMAQSGMGAVLFADNFDTENGGASALNYADFAQFAVTQGTVDLKASGTFGITCKSGSCVDLDGSSHDSGRLYTDAVMLDIPQHIRLSFALSGNQRTAATDTVSYGFIHNGQVYAETRAVASKTPFTTVEMALYDAQPGSYTAFFYNSGGDNVGAVLDDVVVSTMAVASVPLPGSAALLTAGLICLSTARRRRKSALLEQSAFKRNQRASGLALGRRPEAAKAVSTGTPSDLGGGS